MIKINKTTRKKCLRLGQSSLETLLNVKYTAQLSALDESSNSRHGVLININFHTLAGTGEYLHRESKSVGSEHKYHMGTGGGTGASKPMHNPYGTTS